MRAHGRILELLAQGLPQETIAAQLGVTPGWVARVANFHGTRCRPPRKDYAEVQTKVLALLPKSVKEIAAELGLHKDRVYRMIREGTHQRIKRPETPPKPESRPKQRFRQAATLLAEGKTIKEVAATVGVAENTVYGYRKKLGLSTQRQGRIAP